MKFFKNIKLVQKISLLSLSFFIFILIMGYTSIKQISKVNSQIRELNDSRMTPIIELESMKSNVEYIRSQMISLMNETDKDSIKTIENNIADRVSSTNKNLAKYKSNAEFSILIKNYNSFITTKDSFIEAANNGTLSMKNNTQAKTGDNDKKSDNKVKNQPNDMKNVDTTKTALDASFDKIINSYVAAAKQTYNESKRVYGSTLAAEITLIIVCILIVTVLSIVTIRAIVLPVNKVTQKLKEISESNGDLTQRIGYESKDEIG